MRSTIACALLLSAAATPILHAQCPDGTPPPCGARNRAAAPNSVAVLYFQNLSRDTADLYLIDGLAEELTGRLAGVTRLRVPGPSVVRRAQQTAGNDAMTVARALNVRYLVEGSLRRSGPRVRITSRLVRASDGVLVWSDNYDRTINDLLDLQEDIARQVSAAVTGQLLPDERTALVVRPTANPAAYDHYLRGRWLVTRRTDQAFRQAAFEFSEAVRLDPRFAAAEARLASIYVLAFGYGASLASEDSLAAWAHRSAARALQLDSTASDTWLAQAQVHMWFTPYDMEAARAGAERAVRLDSTNAEAVHYLGIVLQSLNDWVPAGASFERALAIDPTRAVSLLDLAEVRVSQGQLAQAKVLLDSALALDPQQSRIYWTRSSVRRRLGDVSGGRSDAEFALRLSSAARIRLGSLAQMLEYETGDPAAVRRRLAEFDTASIRWPIMHALALLHAGLPDSARAVLARGPLIPVDWRLLPLPAFDALRAMPWFERTLDPWRLRRPRS